MCVCEQANELLRTGQCRRCNEIQIRHKTKIINFIFYIISLKFVRYTHTHTNINSFWVCLYDCFFFIWKIYVYKIITIMCLQYYSMTNFIAALHIHTQHIFIWFCYFCYCAWNPFLTIWWILHIYSVIMHNKLAFDYYNTYVYEKDIMFSLNTYTHIHRHKYDTIAHI